MKRRFGVLCLSLGFCMAGWAQSFVIDGELENVEDGVIVELFKVDGNVGSVVAVDTLQGGKFRFEAQAEGGKVNEMSIGCFRGPGFPPMSLDVWINPGTHAKVKGSNKLLYTWQVESDVPQQQTQQRLAGASKDLWDSYQENLIAQDSCQALARGKGVCAEESMRLKALYDSLEVVNRKVQVAIDANTIRLLKQLPVDEVWMKGLKSMAMSVSYMEGYPYKEEAVSLFNSLPESWKQSAVGKDVRTALFPPEVAEAGKPLADGDLYDLQGGVHHLSDFKGKYILLDLWSRGCGPCLMALPEMRELHAQYKERLVMVSLSIDTKEGWEAASKQHEMSWWNLNDLQGMSGLYARYGVRGIPHYVMISPEGIVLEHWEGYGEGLLEEKVKGYLGE